MKKNFLKGFAFLALAMDGDCVTENNFHKQLFVKAGRDAQNRNEGLEEHNNFARYILTEQNKTAGQFDLSTVKTDLSNKGDGKLYNVSLKYRERFSIADVVSEETEANYCATDGISIGYKTENYGISKKYKSVPLVLDRGILHCIKESNLEYTADNFRDYLKKNVDAWLMQVQKELIKKSGNFANSAPQWKNLPLFSGDGSKINVFAQTILRQDKRNAKVSGMVKYFGGNKMEAYAGLKNSSACGCDGFDFESITQLEKKDFVYSECLPTNPDDKNACPLIMYVPGALQVVSVPRYVGDFEYIGEKQRRTTIVDPWLGEKWDVIYNTVTCDEHIKTTVRIEKVWDIIGYPECAFQGDCKMEGVNDIFLYKITCEDTNPCDMKDEVPCNTVPDPLTVEENCDLDECCDKICEFTGTIAIGADGWSSLATISNGVATPMLIPFTTDAPTTAAALEAALSGIYAGATVSETGEVFIPAAPEGVLEILTTDGSTALTQGDCNVVTDEKKKSK